MTHLLRTALSCGTGLALLAAGTAANAAGSASTSLTISANIAANCTISVTPVAFGAYDGVNTNASSALTGSGSVSVLCTSGSSPWVGLDTGLGGTGGSDATPVRALKDGGGDALSYTLYQPAASGSSSATSTVWGNTSGTAPSPVSSTGSSITWTIYGAIAAGQNKPTGTYGDTVQATVNF
jgi:spore coat protein U-like protein